MVQTAPLERHMPDSLPIGQMIAKAYAALREIEPGYKVRPQQQQMIRRASSLFLRDRVGLIEAPTGTGKSAGYLIPGIITAALQNRILIVSTATASLQDQLVARDIPTVLRAIESVEHNGTSIKGVSVVTLKGRERYACPVNLENVAGETADLFQNDDPDRSVIRSLRDSFFDSTWDGTRDTLPDPVSQIVWKKITNSTHSCTGRSCPSVEECPYYSAQTKAKSAQVIVVNHDYLLTSFARLPNSLLADERAIYVVDEGHHFGDKILGAFAHTLPFGDFLSASDMTLAVSLSGANVTKLEFQLEGLKGLWVACERASANLLGGATQHRFQMGDVPIQFTELLLNLKKELEGAQQLVQASRDTMRKHVPASVLRQVNDASLGQIIGKLGEAVACLSDFCSGDPMARWLSNGRRGIEICCSPFDPSSKAKQFVWPKMKTALLTSATIASCGVFEPVLRSLGLPTDTPTLKLGSPFNTERAKVYVPKLALDGNDKAHSRRVIAYLQTIVAKWEQHLGILVYFTNRALMHECFTALPEEIKCTVLMQGNWSPSGLLTEHRSRVDRGQRSIIFGLDTVAEGIDLPGSYCTCVVVTRLPFPSTEDPILATHSEHLRSKGLDPFSLLALPLAGRKFAQVCGRLMRRETDHGEILVLDRRIASKRYGRRLMAGTTYTVLSNPS